jgi:hypothetical protein
MPLRIRMRRTAKQRSWASGSTTAILCSPVGLRDHDDDDDDDNVVLHQGT